jgi:hypothetical protein
MLVTVSDLTNYMDIRFSLRQQDAAEMVLAGLQNELEAFLRRPIEVEEFTEEYVLPSSQHGVPMGTFLSMPNSYMYSDSFYRTNPVDNMLYAEPPNTIYLRNSPVVSVSSVVVKPQHGNIRTLTVNNDYVVRRYGIDYFYGFDNDLVTITYTAGIDGANIPMFKLLILRAATREMQNMHDDVVGVKDLNTRNVAPLITGFLDSELNSVRKYRRVRVA